MIKKIAILSPSLTNGGAQRVASLLTQIFSKLGYEVHLITMYNNVTYNYQATYQSLNLDHFSWKNPFRLIKAFIFLRSYLKKHQFNYVVDVRSRIRFLPELVLYLFALPIQKMIFTFHLPLFHNYLPKPLILFRLFYNNAFKSVCVSNEIHTILKQKKIHNSCVIYNPVDFQLIKVAAKEDILFLPKFVLSVGRMNDNIKQFDHLIEAYANSVLPQNDIHLLILGDGKMKPEFKHMAHQKTCADKIHFLGFVENPYKYYAKAIFFVLTSLFEGFPMVLIEALGCGTPVVAYDCPTGPSEIITDRENGLLVTPNSKMSMTTAINTFYKEKKLYQKCKGRSAASVQHLALDAIGAHWETLLNDKA